MKKWVPPVIHGVSREEVEEAVDELGDGEDEVLVDEEVDEFTDPDVVPPALHQY